MRVQIHIEARRGITTITQNIEPAEFGLLQGLPDDAEIDFEDRPIRIFATGLAMVKNDDGLFSLEGWVLADETGATITHRESNAKYLEGRQKYIDDKLARENDNDPKTMKLVG